MSLGWSSSFSRSHLDRCTISPWEREARTPKYYSEHLLFPFVSLSLLSVFPFLPWPLDKKNTASHSRTYTLIAFSNSIYFPQGSHITFPCSTIPFSILSDQYVRIKTDKNSLKFSFLDKKINLWIISYSEMKDWLILYRDLKRQIKFDYRCGKESTSSLGIPGYINYILIGSRQKFITEGLWIFIFRKDPGKASLKATFHRDLYCGVCVNKWYGFICPFWAYK